MKPKLRWKRGAILLQTLVISVILSMIAVMVLKWVLSRYTIVTRVQRSSMAQGRGAGYATSMAGAINFGTVPSSGSRNLPADSSPQNFIRFDTPAGQPAGQPKRIVYTYDED